MTVAQGVRSIIITSAYDGQYRFSLTRRAPDMDLPHLFVVGVSSDVSAPSANISTSLVLNPAVRYYLLPPVPLHFVEIQLWITFGTPGSVTFACNASSELLNSGVLSSARELAIGPNIFTVDSTLDGLYTFNVTRLGSDLALTSVNAFSDAAGLSSALFDLVPLLNHDPTDMNVVSVQSATVAFGVYSIRVKALFSVVGSVTLGIAGQTSYPLTNGVVSPPFVLCASDTASCIDTVWLNSTADGARLLRITRSAPDITGLDVRGRSLLIGAAALSLAPSLLPAPFSASQRSYTLSGPYYVARIGVRLNFSTSSTASLIIDGGAPTALTTAVYTPSALLSTTAANVFLIESTLDGNYTLTISRASPHVTALDVRRVEIGGAWIATPVALTPPFSSSMYLMNLSVTFLTTNVTVNATFGGGGTLTAACDSTADPPLSLGSGIPSAAFPLLVGVNVLSLVSTLDGTRLIYVYRAAADFTALSLQTTTVLSPSTSPLVDSLLSPPLSLLDHTYTLTLPYWHASLSALPTYATASSVTVQMDSGSLDSVSSGGASPSYPLSVAPATHVLTIASSLDGSFVITVTRAAPHITVLAVRRVEIGGAVVATPVALSPPFASSDYAYELHVTFLTTDLTVEATLAGGGTATAACNSTAAAPLTLTTGTPVGPLPLLVGVNSITINSTLDGTRVILVYRAPADITGLSLTGLTLLTPPTTPSLDAALSPPFSSLPRAYALLVPYELANLTFNVTFLTTSSVTLQQDALTPDSLSSGVPSASYALSFTAPNVFTLLSTQDGAITINVTRTPPHITDLHVWPVLPDGSLSATALVLTPPFTSAHFDYSLSVRYAVSSMSLEAAFTNAGTVQFSREGGASSIAAADSVPSVGLVLRLSSNQLWLNSTVDAPRLLRVSRDLPDVTSVLIRGVSVPDASAVPLRSLLQPAQFPSDATLYSLSLSYSTSSSVAFRFVFSSAVGANLTVQSSGEVIALSSGTYTADLPLSFLAPNLFTLTSADGACVFNVTRSVPQVSTINLWQQLSNGTVVAVGFTPAFAPSVFSYSLALPYSVTQFAVSAEFRASAGALTFTRNASTVALSSGVQTAFRPLFALPALNVFSFQSVDGVYVLTLTQPSVCGSGGSSPLCLNGGLCMPNPSIGASPAYSCNCTYGFTGADCSTCTLGSACNLPVGVLVPEAHLTALPQPTVGPCDMLTLDGSGSIGFGTSTPVYLWRLESVTLQDGQLFWANASTALNPLPPFNESLGVTLGSFPANGARHTILLPAHLLLDNATYAFTLSVGVLAVDLSPVYSSVARVSVTKQADSGVAWMPKPMVSVPASIVRSAQAQFDVTMQPSTCAPMPADAVHSFAWSVTPAAGGATVFSSSKIPLRIPANTLLAGTAYSVRLKLTTSSVSAGSALGSRRLLSAATGTAIVTFPITVSVQPLQASILYGLRQKTVNADFTIDGSLSNDPDWAGAAPPPYPFTFAWTATWVPQPNPSNVASAVWTFASGIATNGPSIYLPRMTFASIVGSTPRVTFRLSIASTVDSRTDSTTVDVDVLPQFPELPSVSLLAPASRNPSQSLTIQGKVFYNSSSPLATRSDLLDFLWTSVSHPYLNFQSSLLVSSDLNGVNLVVRPNVLPPGFHQFRLTATDPAFAATATPVSAFGETTVMINSPPYGGTCDVSPNAGEALNTLFSISCAGWMDPQRYEPLQYEFSSFDLIADPTLSNAKLLRSAISSSSYSSQLPAGQLALQVSIIDTAGATGTFLMPVNVTLSALALSDPAAYVANMTANLAAIIGQQNSDAAFLIITELANVLNTVPPTGGSAAATDQLRQDLLTSLATVAGTGTNSTMSPSTLQQVSQALGALTSDAGGLNNTHTWDLAQSVLNDAIANIPKSGDGDYTAIVNNLATSTSNMLVDCAYLDSVSDITQALLTAALNGLTTGSGNVLNTTNLQASATRDSIAGGANITLANGVVVTLTAEALAQYAHQTAATGASADTAAGVGGLALDTRVVTFDNRWAACRSTGGSGVVSSSLTTIDITLSNGQVVDISQLLSPISFLIPFNLSDANIPPPRHCSGEINTAPDAYADVLTCSYWDPRNKTYSSKGCRNLGFANNMTAINCSCGHLTEFAIIYDSQLAQATGDCTESFGLLYYLIYAALYSTVGLLSAVQFARVTAASGCKHWLMAVEHALVLAVSLFRAWNMINFYTLYQVIPFKWITIISGVPHLFTSWSESSSSGSSSRLRNAPGRRAEGCATLTTLWFVVCARLLSAVCQDLYFRS